MKACFITFGCRLSRAEALDEEAAYQAKGWELTDQHAEADLFVVRGCSVTSRAQHECEKLIDHLRRKYPFTQLKICGCLDQAKKTSPLLHARGITPATLAAGNNAAAPVPTRTARAYLKVQDGCSGKCTFCIVPRFRGASRSVPFEEVLDKARRFVDAGYHEIVVTGCNLSLYASGGKRLPELLAALAQISPNCRIRLGSIEPGACAIETVDVLAEQANACKFLHIPIQSGSNATLSAMRRPYLVKDIESLVTKAVSLMPHIGLGCDVMTGFPGETDMDFLATRGLLERMPFSNAHVFPYSERPDTPAAASLNIVPKPVRSERAHELADLIRTKRHRFAKSFIGQEVEIVVEDEKKQAGWTSEYLWFEKVTTAGQTPTPRKWLLRAKVFTASSHRLQGR